ASQEQFSNSAILVSKSAMEPTIRHDRGNQIGRVAHICCPLFPIINLGAPGLAAFARPGNISRSFRPVCHDKNVSVINLDWSRLTITILAVAAPSPVFGRND